jgi:hypothetical protein
MIYAIATERGIRMPSFFGYIIWSVIVLGPVFAVVNYFFVMGQSWSSLLHLLQLR